MKAKLENGKVTIDLQDLIDTLSLDDCRDVARHVVADEYLFKAVLECVAKGEYFTDDERGAWWFDERTVLEMRAKLLPLMPEIAREAVEAALHQRDEAKAESERHRRWAYQLYHAWPDAHWSARPRGPEDWHPTPRPKDAEIDAFMTPQSALSESQGTGEP